MPFLFIFQYSVTLFVFTEWYDPSAVTTKDGKMVITMTEVLNHDLNFMSGKSGNCQFFRGRL